MTFKGQFDELPSQRPKEVIIRTRIICLLALLCALTGFTSTASAADPITREGCRNALLGNHVKAPDHDVARYAQNNLWGSYHVYPYELFEKNWGPYYARGRVDFTDPIWPNVTTKRSTYGYCVRFEGNGLGDRLDSWPTTTG